MNQRLAPVVVLITLLPLLAQTAVPKETANGLMLGSWNTQVEYDDAKVVAETNTKDFKVKVGKTLEWGGR